MQENLEALMLLDFPIPKPIIVSRLEPEEELGVPDPNDCKEWQILRVAPPDDPAPSDADPSSSRSCSPPGAGAPPELAALLRAPLAPEPPPEPRSPPWAPRSAPGPPRGGSRGPRRARGRAGPARRSLRQPPEPSAEPPKLFPCPACGKSFARGSGRAAHLGQRRCRARCGHRCSGHHCGHCGRAPGARGGHCGHHCGRGAEGRQRGRGCGGRGAELGAHLRAPLGERPYTCGECGRGFSYSSAFLKHRRGHRGGQRGAREGERRGRAAGRERLQLG